MDAFAALKGLKNRVFALRGRQAKPATARFNGLKTLGQTLAMWTIFLALGPLVAFSIEEFSGLDRFRFNFPRQTLCGAVTFVFGWCVAWTSAYWMVTRGDGTPLPIDATRKLVVAGPYRRVRNPMALGSLLQGAAIGMIAGSPLVLIYIGAGALLWNFAARPWEEHDLERKFGADYAHYKRQVRCWTPRLRPYNPDSMSSHPTQQNLQPVPGHKSASVEAHRDEAPDSVRCCVLVVSDTRTLETDGGGALIETLLKSAGHQVLSRQIVRDEIESIRGAVQQASNGIGDPEAILVTGGSGIGPRDVTPEALRPLLTRELPGFGEMFRVLSFEEIGAATMLSRAFAGVMGRTLLFVLPGSTNAVRLAMERLIVPEIGHLVREVHPERRK